MRAQRPERPGVGLPPVVDDDLVHDLEQPELDRADGPVWHHERAALDPFGLQQRRRLGQPRRLDDDVGAPDALLPAGDRAYLPPEIGAQPLRELLAALGAQRVDSSPPRAPGVRGRAGARSSRRSRARRYDRARERRAAARYSPPIAVTAPVRISVIAVASMIATGTPVAGVHQQQQRELRRQPETVVVDEVADDLDAGVIAGHAAQDVEMALDSLRERGASAARSRSRPAPGRRSRPAPNRGSRRR